MKFNNGEWLLLPGVEAVQPRSVVEVEYEAGVIIVTAFSREVHGRGDLTDGSIFIFRFSSPMPGVIRVQVGHHKGRKTRMPVFDLDYGLTNPEVRTGRDEHTAWLKNGSLTVHVSLEGEFRYYFESAGNVLTESKPEAFGLITLQGQTYTREQLSLQPGEKVYGLGEHFGPLIKNGQSIDMWNEDGGTSSEQAYKNIPFYLTDRGYGVLVNNPGRVSFEVASHHVRRVQFSATGHDLDYYIFDGPAPKNIIDRYTQLSGRPALPPEWSFGLWLSTSFTTNYDEKTVLGYIDRMAVSGIPVSVIHFDCFWMKPLTWCSLLWDAVNFPDPTSMIHHIHEKGARVCLWINPYIAEASPLFTEGMQAGFLLKKTNGEIYQVDRWQPGMGIVDFTNPAACAWYAGKLRALLEMGVDTFKTDFGERIPLDICYHDGSDPERMHNYYSLLYNRTVFNLLQKVKGEGEAVVFARAATCGCQQFPVHWGGDCAATYASMAETLRGGLSLGLSGFGFWSHDISGFIGTATPDLYKRWVAFGMLSSHSRLHGMDSPRVPWNFDEEAVDVLRFFTRLKLHLMPYILDASRQAHEHGLPVMRSMFLEFPDDPVCRYLEMQYMLGEALLVTPIFNESGIVEYYLPTGAWRNLLTGEVVHGPTWQKETHGYLSLPLWVNEDRGKAWECLQGYKGE